MTQDTPSERQIADEFPFVNILHPAHLRYIRDVPTNTLAQMFSCLEDFDSEIRDHVLWLAQMAIIQPRKRPPINGQETDVELYMDEISYPAFKEKCRELVTAGLMDQMTLATAIVNMTLQFAFGMADTTRIQERIEEGRQHIEFMKSHMDLLKERGLSPGIAYSMTKMQERGIRELSERTRQSYQEYWHFCEHVVARLLQERPPLR